MEPEETQQLLLEHVRQLAAEVAELRQEGAAPLTDNLAHWLAAQFVVAAKKAAQESENGCLDLKTLQALNADVVALRHGDHSAERLKTEREWLELEIEKFKAQSLTKLDIAFTELAADTKGNPRAMEIFESFRQEVMKDQARAN